MTEHDLLKLKERISTAKDIVNKLKGRLEVIRETLDVQWGCSTIEEAKQKLEELKARKDDLQRKIDEGIQKLEDEYEFAEN